MVLKVYLYKKFIRPSIGTFFAFSSIILKQHSKPCAHHPQWWGLFEGASSMGAYSRGHFRGDLVKGANSRTFNINQGHCVSIFY